MLRGALALALFAACGSQSTPSPEPVASGSAVVVAPADAAAADAAAPQLSVPPTTARRPPAPPRPFDRTGIEWSKFTTTLNSLDAAGRTIHATPDGGCAVYIRDPKAPIGPPGMYPAPTSVPCPPAMLAVEWGYCTGGSEVRANADRSECICRSGEGDPPPPPWRVPCPPR